VHVAVLAVDSLRDGRPRLRFGASTGGGVDSASENARWLGVGESAGVSSIVGVITWLWFRVK